MRSDNAFNFIATNRRKKNTLTELPLSDNNFCVWCAPFILEKSMKSIKIAFTHAMAMKKIDKILNEILFTGDFLLQFSVYLILNYIIWKIIFTRKNHLNSNKWIRLKIERQEISDGKITQITHFYPKFERHSLFCLLIQMNIHLLLKFNALAHKKMHDRIYVYFTHSFLNSTRTYLFPFNRNVLWTRFIRFRLVFIFWRFFGQMWMQTTEILRLDRRFFLVKTYECGWKFKCITFLCIHSFIEKKKKEKEINVCIALFEATHNQYHIIC